MRACWRGIGERRGPHSNVASLCQDLLQPPPTRASPPHGRLAPEPPPLPRPRFSWATRFMKRGAERCERPADGRDAEVGALRLEGGAKMLS